MNDTPLIREYTKEIADLLCEELIMGKSLVFACRKHHVDYRMVFKWIKEVEEFRDNYAHARETQADYLADGVIDVADDMSIPADSRRVMVDARKWYAGKLKPKKYGDRTTVAGDPDAPIEHSIDVNFIGKNKS